nr:hypothetical protein [Chitinophagaceae bacterium]
PVFQERHAGLIAQEVQNAAKSFTKEGIADIIVTSDNENELRSIRYELLVVPLVKTIQQQQAAIKQIETMIAQLEAQLK